MHADLWHDFNRSWWQRMKKRAALDGTTRSAVRYLTGLDDVRFDELGGFADDERA